jgi:hypothetical protein
VSLLREYPNWHCKQFPEILLYVVQKFIKFGQKVPSEKVVSSALQVLHSDLFFMTWQFAKF